MSIPRPEHPQPQFERSSWMNLNGQWDFTLDLNKSGYEKGYKDGFEPTHKINVPFCPESELSGVGYRDFIAAVWYHRTVNITSEQLSGKVYIRFGAVDYDCTVFVNGKAAGNHKGGYTSFAFEISKLLKEGENHITVYAADDARSPVQPSGKQSERYASYGCLYTRTTGIWQTVWLEFTPCTHIESVKYYPNIAEGTLTIQAKVEGEGTFEAKASYEGKACGTVSARAVGPTVSVTLSLDEVHLWEPGCGRLYDLELSFGEDKVKSYFGMREVKLSGYKFLINGRSVFQRLILDQGFYPDGIYTAPSDEALLNDIRLSMAAGFNGARLHEKVFEARFLYHCDKMGYLVWGEFPNWGMDHSSYKAFSSFPGEWTEAVERDFNHPAIIGWCPFNETDGHRQIHRLLEYVYLLTKSLDSTRPCLDASGYSHVKTDIYDVHDYEQDVAAFEEHYRAFKEGTGAFYDGAARAQAFAYPEGMPMFVSEYGGIEWAPDSTDADAWGYGDEPKTIEEYQARYKGLTDALLDNPKMFAFCYTQLTDVEQEQNGVYFYDRRPKMDISFFHKVNTRKAAIED